MNKSRKGRPTVAEIDRAAIRENFAAIKAHVGDKVAMMAVVKADAYGHGGPEVARVLEREGARGFGVATVEEAVKLRDAGVVHPEVFVLSGFVADQVEEIMLHRLTPVVCDLEMARVLDRRLRTSMRKMSVHLKVDCGLGRLGVTIPDLPSFIGELKKLDRLQIAGVCSHLGSAVTVTGEAADRWVATFVRGWELLAIHGMPAKLRHLANSAAVLARPDAYFDMVRPGLILYGSYPGGAATGALPLRPAMKLRTQVLQLKVLPSGHGVSYDQKFVTVRETKVAVLPIGYADGYPRALSNRGQVLVRGKRASILGVVCMDATVIDVTDVPGVERGDEVVLWGRQGDDEIRVDEVASRAGMIVYELLTTVGPRIPRVYVN